MRIWKQFVDFLFPATILFRTYTPRQDSPQHSQAPPVSQIVQISHTPRPDSPQHSQAPPESQIVQISQTPRPDSPQHSQAPPEFQTTTTTDPADQPAPRPRGQRPHADGYMMMSKEWLLLVMGYCFTAVAAALQALQTPKPLPVTFHCFCMALELSFLCVIVSIYIRRCSQVASLVMDHAAIFLASTAFMLAISMNFPTPFLAITVALYFIAILVIIFANLLMP